MPHADAATFSKEITKPAAYAQVLENLTTLVSDTRFWPTNLANAASLLWHLYHSLPNPSSSVNWAGFYVADSLALASRHGTVDEKAEKLLLGPFMGKVACQVILVGKGVCGAAAQRKETVLVRDVEEFPGHIACDGQSRSEIVVPILVGGECVGVIDIDCAEVDGFDEKDQEGLEAIAKLLAESCDW